MNLNIYTSLIDHISLARFKYRLVNWVKTWVNGLFGAITATADATHSANPTVTPTYSNGVLSLAFSGLQGQSRYLHIRYADSGTPADASMHTTQQSGDKYIGVASTNSDTAPTTASSYTWSKFAGEDGSNGSTPSISASASVDANVGTPSVSVTKSGTDAAPAFAFAFTNMKGEPGGNGSSAYLFIRYSDVASPTDNDIYNSPSSTRKYIGFAITSTPTAPTTANSYTWSKYAGDDGVGIEIKPNAAACTELGHAYIDQDTTHSTFGHIMILTTLPSTFSDGGLIRGVDGTDGESTYLYLAYAASATPAAADIHLTPQSGDKYMGVFIEMTSGASSRPSTYDGYDFWVKFVGDDGTNGTDGSKWYTTTGSAAFNTQSAQNGISTSGTTWKVGDYMMNTDYGYVYKCTLIFAGGTLSNWTYEGCIKGANSYVHIKYAASSTPADADIHSTQQSGDKYIGVYSGNSSSAPTTASSYTWSKYAGDDGTDGNDGTTYTPQIGTVTTGAAGSSASANVRTSGTTATFDFTIPRGNTGADGGIVSKAYRFRDSSNSSILRFGSVVVECSILAADARVTINNEESGYEYADVHVTYLLMPGLINWFDCMTEISAYEGGSSTALMLDGSMDSSAGSHTLNAHNTKGRWYGTLNIRHAYEHQVKDDDTEPLMVLDIHGTMDTSVKFEDLFDDSNDSHYFDFTIY